MHLRSLSAVGGALQTSNLFLLFICFVLFFFIIVVLVLKVQYVLLKNNNL